MTLPSVANRVSVRGLNKVHGPTCLVGRVFSISRRRAGPRAGRDYEPRLIIVTPDWEITCEMVRAGFVEHAFDQYLTAPVISFIEQVRYLALTDPAALGRVIERVGRGGNQP